MRHRGDYKTLPNDVAAFDADGKHLGVVSGTTSPFATPGEMVALIAWTAKALEDRAVHPLIAKESYYIALRQTQGTIRLARPDWQSWLVYFTEATGANLNTIKDHVTALVDEAHLVRHGAGRGSWYAPS